jgi:hypothetical protein
MVEPELGLEAAKARLTPGGVIVASMPNVRHVSVLRDLVVRGDFPYSELGILDRTHLRFFTRRSMERMFAACGFAVQQLSGIGMQRRYKPVSWLAGHLADDFLYPQYAVVAAVVAPRSGPAS